MTQNLKQSRHFESTKIFIVCLFTYVLYGSFHGLVIDFIKYLIYRYGFDFQVNFEFFFSIFGVVIGLIYGLWASISEVIVYKRITKGEQPFPDIKPIRRPWKDKK